MRNLPIEPSLDELQPWHRLGGIEHICELYKSSTVLYGIFTELIRMIYHDTDGRLIGTPDITWSAKGTSLWVDSELRWEDEHPEVRPAIYIQLGQQQVQPFVPYINGKVSLTNRFGEDRYEVKVSGSVSFMHVAETSGEACALADNTEYALRMMQDPICKDFCFTKFESVGRVPLDKLPKESSDRYASVVTFAYEYASSWIVKQECPILKQIDFIDQETVAGYDGNLVVGKSGKHAGHKTINRDNIVTEKQKNLDYLG